MPGNPWTSVAERAFLVNQISEFRNAQQKRSLARYWTELFLEFFSRFPMEAKLGLRPLVFNAPPLLPEETKLLGQATDKMKEVSRYRNLRRNRWPTFFFSSV
jgi:hypothetical protein